LDRAVGDVAHRAHDHGAFLGFQRAQADFHRKLLAALAQAEKLLAGAHLAGARLGKETAAVAQVGTAVALRQQHFHRLAQQLGTGVAEHALGLGIDQDHAARHVHDDDRVGRVLQQVAVLGLHQLAVAQRLQVRDILHAVQQVAPVGPAFVHQLGGNGHVHDAAVPAAAHRFVYNQPVAQRIARAALVFGPAVRRDDQVSQAAMQGLVAGIAERGDGRLVPMQHLPGRRGDDDGVGAGTPQQ
jgi:hypothetical protein